MANLLLAFVLIRVNLEGAFRNFFAIYIEFYAVRARNKGATFGTSIPTIVTGSLPFRMNLRFPCAFVYLFPVWSVPNRLECEFYCILQEWMGEI